VLRPSEPLKGFSGMMQINDPAIALQADRQVVAAHVSWADA
jgi:hypothetical protein